MDRSSGFSYLCNQCGRCCHGQVITLSPYDLIRLARAAGISTGEASVRYTIRRGSILRFDHNGGCAALDGTTCSLHAGRPLACRLYPLGLEYAPSGAERYMRLEPAAGSRGIYGDRGSVRDFLVAQEVELHLRANRRYAELLAILRLRIADVTDFDIVEPREFWRVAVREALAETGFNFNPIIEALFDPDSLGFRDASEAGFIEQHVKAIERRIYSEHDPVILAAAAVMLAVSLGYSPSEAMIESTRNL